MVVVNGNDARHQAGLATHLAGDPMSFRILPIIGGGEGNIASTQRSSLSAFSKGTTTRVGSKRLTPAVIGRFCVALGGLNADR